MEDLELLTQTDTPRTGVGIYRMRIQDFSKSNSPHKYFQVWVTEDFMVRRTPDFAELDMRKKLQELEDCAENLYSSFSEQERLKAGVFVTTKEMQFVDEPTEFTDFLDKFDSLVQTNVSLPESLHEWTKVESARTKQSLSEVIRQALLQYKRFSYNCTHCSRKRYGLPFYQDGKQKNCRECFLKAFEEK